jgi:hypothetical protein
MLLKTHVEKMSAPSFATMLMIKNELQILATMLMKQQKLTLSGRAVSGEAVNWKSGFCHQNPGAIGPKCISGGGSNVVGNGVFSLSPLGIIP